MGPKRVSVRLMVPFSMQCDHCESYIYKSTKFNARKSVTKEKYLGIPIIEFEFRCSSCSAPIRFRTDPQSRGYKLCDGAHELEADLRLQPKQPASSSEGQPGLSPSETAMSKTEAARLAHMRKMMMGRAPGQGMCELPKPKPRKHLLRQ